MAPAGVQRGGNNGREYRRHGGETVNCQMAGCRLSIEQAGPGLGCCTCVACCAVSRRLARQTSVKPVSTACLATRSLPALRPAAGRRNATGGRVPACLPNRHPGTSARAALATISGRHPGAGVEIQASAGGRARPGARHGLRTAARHWPRRRQFWLVPVPLHSCRYLLRGFNQADELAHARWRAQTGLPLAGRWLRRCRRTPAQSGTQARQRRENLHGAFRWHGPALAGGADDPG